MENHLGMTLKNGLLAMFAMLLAVPLTAQVKVDTTIKAETLVKEVIAGRGIRVRNIRYWGNPEALGQVTHEENIPVYQNAVILSTGKAADFAGPNQRPKTSTVNYKPGDKDLYLLAKNRTFDAAILEFDFMADRDSVSFNFMFASEEYNDFVGSTFGDAFVVMLSGPGFRNGINLANVPGTLAPININSVGFNANRQYYVDNNPFTLAGKPNPKRRAELNQNLLKHIEYDGLTKSFSVGYKVQPKTSYKLRLAIADAGDGQVDSALLFEGKSLESREQNWRVVKRAEIEAQRIADSTALADSLAAVRAAELARIADSIALADSLTNLEQLQMLEEQNSEEEFPSEEVQDEAPEQETTLPQTNPLPKPNRTIPQEEVLFEKEDDPVEEVLITDPQVPSNSTWSNPYHSPILHGASEYMLLFEYEGEDYFIQESEDAMVDKLAAFLKANPGKRAGLFTPAGSSNADLRYDIVRLDLIKGGVAPEALFQNGFSFLNPSQQEAAPKERLEIWVR